jgi:hypothetical protein
LSLCHILDNLCEISHVETVKELFGSGSKLGIS